MSVSAYLLLAGSLLVMYYSLVPYFSCITGDKLLLEVPNTELAKYGDRGFLKAAPLLWNKLPVTIRNRSELVSFTRSLKTHLYNIAFD